MEGTPEKRWSSLNEDEKEAIRQSGRRKREMRKVAKDQSTLGSDPGGAVIPGEEGHSGKGVARQIPGGDGDVDKKGDEKGKGVDTQMKSLSMEKKIPVSYPIFRVSSSSHNAIEWMDENFHGTRPSGDLPVANTKKSSKWKTSKIVSYTKQRSRIGISVCCSFEEAIKLADEKAVSVIQKERRSGKGKDGLIHLLHGHRDQEWPIDSSTQHPFGHATINSTYGEDNGEVYMPKLEAFDQMMGEYVASLTYETDICFGGEFVVKRTDLQKKEGGNDEWNDVISEGFSSTIKPME